LALLILWLSKEEGGRAQPPTGEGPVPYMPGIWFPDEPWPYNWTACVTKDHDASQPDLWLADVVYRVKEAPHDSIRQGREFELYEGGRLVARGKFVGDSLDPSDLDQLLARSRR
jgi:hypothetical protein